MKKLCVKKPVKILAAFASISKLQINNLRLVTTALIAFAFFILLLLIAFPTTNQNFIEISSQRNNIDLALKQMISGSRFPSRNPHSEVSPAIKKRLDSLERGELPASSHYDDKNTYQGTTASFPYVYPVMGPRKSSGYGLRVHPIRGFSTNHKGIDLAAPVGASIRAMSKGLVIFADPYAGYGNLVVIDHGKGVTTHYAHCDKLTVHTGQTVETGQMIAEVGSTGMSTGPHLHLEVRIKGQPLNPEGFFVGLADKAEG